MDFSIYNFLVAFLSFIMMVMIMVFVHEWGHFYAARFFDVKVETFAIGFGKKLWSRKDKKETEWSINMIPAGGYVKMYGDAGEASDIDVNKISAMTEEEKSKTFYYKKLWQKAIIIFAGPFMNYVLAIIVMFAMLNIYGIQTIYPRVTIVEDGSPAAVAGIIANDIIVSVNGVKMNNFLELKKIINKNDALLSIIIERNGIEKHIEVTSENKKIGVGGGEIVHQDVSIADAFILSFVKIYELNNMMLSGLYQLVSGNGSMNDLGGPIKIAQIAGKAAERGLESFLSLMILLSLNLGLLNLIPIPGLDGGHLMYYLVNTIIGKPIPEKIQIIGIKVGIFLLISLTVFITWKDVVDIFK